MSVRVMTWVWNHSRSRGNDRLVLLAIADSAEDDGGNAWPSQERLARKTGLTVRTIRTSIDWLRRINELAVERRRDARGRQAVSTYAVLMHGRRKDLPPDHQSEGTPSSSPEAPPPPHRRQDLPTDVSGAAEEHVPAAREKALPPAPPEGHDTVRRQNLPPYSGDPSGDPSDPPVVPPGDAPPARWPRFTAEGDTLARELWSRLDPKPIAGFGAFRERLSQCLAAGYTADALRRVAGHVDVLVPSRHRDGVRQQWRQPEGIEATCTETPETATSRLAGAACSTTDLRGARRMGGSERGGPGECGRAGAQTSSDRNHLG